MFHCIHVQTRKTTIKRVDIPNKWLLCQLLSLYFLLSFSLVPSHAEKSLSLWTINPNTAFGELIDSLAQDYSSANNGYKLNSVHYANNYYKFNLRAAIDDNKGPDIFHNWGGSSIRKYVRNGSILSLDDVEDTLKEDILPLAFKPVTFDNKIYGVPYSGLAGVFFWYRKDVFAKLDLSSPKTWEDFIQVGEKLKENGLIPIALANKNKWPGSFFYMYLVDRIGGANLFSEAFHRKHNTTFTDVAFVKAGQYIQDLVKRGFFPKGFNQTADEPGNWNSLFISGQAGMYLMGSWFVSALNTLPPELREKFDFFVFPTVEDGNGSSLNLVGSPGQDYLSVASSCVEPAAAKKFLIEYIASETYFKKLAQLGFVPPVRNAGKYLADPISKKVAEVFSSAKNVQIYYDQIMPMTMAEAHKVLIHQLFELRISPEQVAQSHENLILSEFQR